MNVLYNLPINPSKQHASAEAESICGVLIGWLSKDKRFRCAQQLCMPLIGPSMSLAYMLQICAYMEQERLGDGG